MEKKSLIYPSLQSHSLDRFVALSPDPSSVGERSSASAMTEADVSEPVATETVVSGATVSKTTISEATVSVAFIVSESRNGSEAVVVSIVIDRRRSEESALGQDAIVVTAIRKCRRSLQENKCKQTRISDTKQPRLLKATRKRKSKLKSESTSILQRPRRFDGF
jgi:hypothetical protein